jgi:hypothetical protein
MKQTEIILETASEIRSGKKTQLLYGAVLLLVSILLGFVTANSGIGTGLLFFFLLFLCIPMIYAMVAHPHFGILMVLILAYLLFVIGRFITDFPLGTVMDAMYMLLIFGVIIRQKTERNWQLFNEPIAYVILFWLGYNIIQAANPSAESRLAWLYTVRSVAIVTLTYFVFVYNIRTVNFIRTIIKLWIILAVLGALYGLKQTFFGFSESEMTNIEDNPKLYSLLYVEGHWRMFSFFADPVTYAYNMVASSLLCFGLMTGNFKFWKKIILGLLGCLFLFAMLYSGTRGAFVLFPAGLLLFPVLKFNKTVMIFTILGLLLIVFLIFVPTHNYAINRFQSAFKPSKDASFNVRKVNQKRIQPYIQTHPFDGGLGSTGMWGERFAPHSYLANFPPDSGYVRVAVELGWIGLILFCTMMFVILKTGIKNYYRIRDPELKTYCFAMILIAFAFNIGNFPQEALVQLPSSVYFYLVVALMTVTFRIDQQKETKIVN